MIRSIYIDEDSDNVLHESKFNTAVIGDKLRHNDQWYEVTEIDHPRGNADAPTYVYCKAVPA